MCNVAEQIHEEYSVKLGSTYTLILELRASVPFIVPVGEKQDHARTQAAGVEVLWSGIFMHRDIGGGSWGARRCNGTRSHPVVVCRWGLMMRDLGCWVRGERCGS